MVIHAAGSSIGSSWRARRRSASCATSSASETLPSIRYAMPKPCRRSASRSLVSVALEAMIRPYSRMQARLADPVV